MLGNQTQTQKHSALSEWPISGLLLCCRKDPRSLPEYGGGVLLGIYEAMSMQDQEIGRCCGCHKLLVSQICVQICPKTPDKAVLMDVMLVYKLITS